MASADTHLPIRTRAPVLQGFNARLNLGKVRCSLDGIGDGGKEYVGIRFLYVVDGRLDIAELFSFIAPHQKHARLYSAGPAQRDSLLHLLDGHPALHCVEDSLRAALGADPKPETSHGRQSVDNRGSKPVGARDTLEGETQSAAF